MTTTSTPVSPYAFAAALLLSSAALMQTECTGCAFSIDVDTTHGHMPAGLTLGFVRLEATGGYCEPLFGCEWVLGCSTDGLSLFVSNNSLYPMTITTYGSTDADFMGPDSTNILFPSSTLLGTVPGWQHELECHEPSESAQAPDTPLSPTLGRVTWTDEYDRVLYISVFAVCSRCRVE